MGAESARCTVQKALGESVGEGQSLGLRAEMAQRLAARWYRVQEAKAKQHLDREQQDESQSDLNGHPRLLSLADHEQGTPV